MKIRVVEVAQGRVVEVDQSPAWMAHGQLQALSLQWSPDSRWLTWARRPANSGNAAVFVFDVTRGTRSQVTSAYFNDMEPTFDPDGKYPLLLLEPDVRSRLQRLRQQLVVPQRDAHRRGHAARGHAVAACAEKRRRGRSRTRRTRGRRQEGRREEGRGKKEARKPTKRRTRRRPAPKPVDIDIEGFESRVVVLPPKAGNYDGLEAVAGKMLYRRQPRTGSGEEKSALVYYDLDEREEKTVAGSVDGFEVTADGKKVLVASDKKFAIVDVKADQKLDKPMRTGEMEALVDPAAEWRQMFADAYRVERDYFYDPHAAWRRLEGHARALRAADRRVGDAVGRQLRARRVHRASSTPRTPTTAAAIWRRAPGAQRRHARRGLGGRAGRLSHQAHRRRRPVGRRRALAALAARRRR